MHLVCERCPKEMSPHIFTVIKLCLKYITYDPNYNYDADDDQEDSMDTEDGGDEDQGAVSIVALPRQPHKRTGVTGETSVSTGMGVVPIPGVVLGY